MAEDCADSEVLLNLAAGGSDSAREQLLVLHRRRLLRMVALHLDRRMSARIDASDVVQDALAEADRRLDEYLRSRPLPFYPWLRHFAWERLVQIHRHHLKTKKRSVVLEQAWDRTIVNESAHLLADRLATSGTSPSGKMMKEERRSVVRAALARLSTRDREVLALRYLEQLKTL